MDITIWRERAHAKCLEMKKWHPSKVSYSAYSTLAALSLWPLIESPLPSQELSQLLENNTLPDTSGSGLIIAQIQKWQHSIEVITEDDVIGWLANQLSENTVLHQTIDKIVEQLGTIAFATSHFANADLVWFISQLQQDFQALGASDKLDAILLGSGVIVKGDRNIVVAERGVYVQGNVAGSVVTGTQIIINNPSIPASPEPVVIPTQLFEPEMVSIPAGPFLMGATPQSNASDWEKPQFTIELPDYSISKYPITVGEYAQFLEDSGKPAPQQTGWLTLKPTAARAILPVSGVSWYDAMAYCQWLQEKTGRPYCLPTEAEWEKAARGIDGRLYPWGNEWDSSKCNNSNKITAVNAFPDGQSPYGCLDMVGNLREWTSTLWGTDWRTNRSSFTYPYQHHDQRDDPSASPDIYRILRGGSFQDNSDQLQCTTRFWYDPNGKDKLHGFRVVMSDALVA